MNEHWIKSYKQIKDDDDRVKDRRNFIYSGAIVIGLYIVGFGMGYFTDKTKNTRNAGNFDYTNRLERVINK